MATIPAAVITGIGAFVPPRAVTNQELFASHGITDEWIKSRTGIEQRYRVQDGISTSDLAAEAGVRALQNAGVDEVGMVVLSTTTPDRIIPTTAPAASRKMGMAGVPAVDVGAVCCGFVYGLQMAAGLIMSGLMDTILVVSAETASVFMDPNDPANSAIFGDGAGAVVLRAGDRAERGALLAFDCGSDGSLADIITVRAGGAEQRSRGGEVDIEDTMFQMDGRTVFSNAVRRMSESSRAVLRKTGWEAPDVDKFVGHQANKRILLAVAEGVGILADRAVINIQNVGNTASASIPLALAEHAADGLLTPGDRMLISAFGGGATWGSATFLWPDLKLPEQYNQPRQGAL